MSFKALLFDFDGVIVESVDVKTRAFRQLFAVETEFLPAIIAFHLANGGMSRFAKFEVIYRDILHRPLSAAQSRELGSRFSELVKEAVIACPLVPGALEFLEKYAVRLPLALASATPQDELIEIVTRRGLNTFFEAIHGAPRSKTEIMNQLLHEFSLTPSEVPFIGDSINDYNAAAQAALPFVGRVPPESVNPFPAHIPVVQDLRGLESVLFGQRESKLWNAA